MRYTLWTAEISNFSQLLLARRQKVAEYVVCSLSKLPLNIGRHAHKLLNATTAGHILRLQLSKSTSAIQVL